MSSESPAGEPRKLTEAESRRLREFATAMVLNGQVTAETAGLHPIDLYALNLLDLDGQATAGELAQRTALTTGAVTKLIDRLANAGLVERTPDPADRRRVLLSVTGRVTEAIGERAELFASVSHRMDALLTSFPSEQRAVLFEFFTRAAEELQRSTEEIQRQYPRGREK